MASGAACVSTGLDNVVQVLDVVPRLRADVGLSRYAHGTPPGGTTAIDASTELNGPMGPAPDAPRGGCIPQPPQEPVPVPPSVDRAYRRPRASSLTRSAHAPRVKLGRVVGVDTFRAVCSCGWADEYRLTEFAATGDVAAHRRAYRGAALARERVQEPVRGRVLADATPRPDEPSAEASRADSNATA